MDENKVEVAAEEIVKDAEVIENVEASSVEVPVEVAETTPAEVVEVPADAPAVEVDHSEPEQA